jgi:hypothetical protein
LPRPPPLLAMASVPGSTSRPFATKAPIPRRGRDPRSPGVNHRSVLDGQGGVYQVSSVSYARAREGAVPRGSARQGRRRRSGGESGIPDAVRGPPPGLAKAVGQCERDANLMRGRPCEDQWELRLAPGLRGLPSCPP